MKEIILTCDNCKAVVKDDSELYLLQLHWTTAARPFSPHRSASVACREEWCRDCMNKLQIFGRTKPKPEEPVVKALSFAEKLEGILVDLVNEAVENR